MFALTSSAILFNKLIREIVWTNGKNHKTFHFFFPSFQFLFTFAYAYVDSFEATKELEKFISIAIGAILRLGDVISISRPVVNLIECEF